MQTVIQAKTAKETLYTHWNSELKNASKRLVQMSAKYLNPARNQPVFKYAIYLL